MSNKDTKESRIETLRTTQKQRQEDARNRVYQAIERLQKLNAKINFHTISREAQVSVSYLYYCKTKYATKKGKSRIINSAFI